MSTLYIGVMSGTSLDGVDAVLVDFASGCQILGHHVLPFPPHLKQAFLSLNQTGDDELHRSALAANALAQLYAQAIQSLLKTHTLNPSAISAVGAHGQTVRHQPGLHDGVGYTLQLNNPALLAELCNIPVVADFRSRDVAAGGQGAPLVPAFHQFVWGNATETTAVLNIGGMANLSILSPDKHVIGFDCGPGNVLLDMWCQRHLGKAFDDKGSWAGSGQASPTLVQEMLSEPFFALAPPKSTGRDLFNAEWLDRHVKNFRTLLPNDIQASLAMLTAKSAAHAIQRFAPTTQQVLVCGGGAYNQHLMDLLINHLPQCAVDTSQSQGVPPLQVEAAAFAWLARQYVLGLPGNVPNATGARGLRVLGGLYPA
jgi:anhydro-N-acetylmuramic acid kinase